MFEKGVVEEKVHVYVRVRPRVTAGDDDEADDEQAATFVTPQAAADDEPCVELLEGGTSCLYTGGTQEPKRYDFQRCIGGEATQAEVYDSCARRVVTAVASGYNGTILAYGQTGSGKTHTMRGTVDEAGIVSRALAQLVEVEAKECAKIGVTMTLSLSYVEIYNEVLADLLVDEYEGGSSRRNSLSIRERPAHDGGGVYVEGLSRVSVPTVQAALEFLEQGDSRRATAATLYNAESSRSHACALIHVERRTTEEALTRSTLTLVDLAGSERAKGTMDRPSRFEECKAINLSLSALGNCVAALAAKRPHVPFRDSKLTRLLQASLGGCARTSIVATVRGGHDEVAENTRSTLEFASRASQVQVKAAPQELEVDYQKLYADAQSKVDSAEGRASKAEMEAADLKAKNSSTGASLEGAQTQVEQLEHRLSQAESRHAEAMKALRRTKAEDADGTGAAEAIEDLHTRWASDAAESEERHAAAATLAKSKNEERLKAYRQAATTSAEECERYEEELTEERRGHLESLAALRKMRLEKQDVEDRSAARVAELLAELEDLREKHGDLTEQLEGVRVEKATTQRQLADRLVTLEQATVDELKQRDDDYVSRDRVAEMEALYTQAIECLTKRLYALEEDRDQQLAKSVANGGARTGVSDAARSILESLEQDTNNSRRLPSLGAGVGLPPAPRQGGHRKNHAMGGHNRQPSFRQPPAIKPGRRPLADPRAKFY